MEEIFCVDQ